VVRGGPTARRARCAAPSARRRSRGGPLERLFTARRELSRAETFGAGVRALLSVGDGLLPDATGGAAECRAAREQALDRVDAAAGRGADPTQRPSRTRSSRRCSSRASPGAGATTEGSVLMPRRLGAAFAAICS
jgi:hypothetical protein